MFDPKNIDEIAKQVKEWNSKVDKSLAKNPERKKDFQTTSGIAVKRVFSPEDIAGLDYEQDLNLPGEFPYTRGVQPTMYRGRFWTMRQYAGFGTAEDTNRRYRYLLEQGQTGLSVAFDLPDPDRLRFRPPSGPGRGREGGGGHRFAEGHGDPLRPDPPG